MKNTRHNKKRKTNTSKNKLLKKYLAIEKNDQKDIIKTPMVESKTKDWDPGLHY